MVKYHEDNVNSKKEIIKLEPKKPQIIKPGEIHTILCMSEIVEAVEFKLVSSAKIFPNFVKEMGLVDEQGREQSGLTVNEYLNNLHNEVSNFSNSSL